MSKIIALDETLIGPQGQSDETAPPQGHLAIVPSDTNMYYPPLREIRVGGTGDVNIRLAGSSNVEVYKNCSAGEYISGRIAQVYLTDTTATDMVGRW